MSHYEGSVPTTEPAGQWLKAAACRAPGIHPDEMFPDDSNEAGIERARSICRRCPVRAACLDECLQREGGRSSVSRFGVYAGLTPRQRAREYARRRDQQKKQAAVHPPPPPGGCRAPNPAHRKAPPVTAQPGRTTLKGDAREQARHRAAELYMQGCAIRSVARQIGRSYGGTRDLLLEAGVRLRARGGGIREVTV